MNSILKQMTGEELLALSALSGSSAVFDAVDAELDRRARSARLRRLCEDKPRVMARRVAGRPAAAISTAA